MEIKLSDPEATPDLLHFLHEEGCVATQTGAETIEAAPEPASLRGDHIRMQLELRLAVWCSRHPDIAVELALEGRDPRET